MKRNSQTGSRTFFIEFLIALFFFLIISTVCLRVFARAYTITRRSEATANAQAAAASVAAVVEAGNVSPEDAASFFPGAVAASDGFSVFYDQDFSPCPQEQAAYALTLTLRQEGQETTADIAVNGADQSVLYGLSVTFHQPITGKEALS